MDEDALEKLRAGESHLISRVSQACSATEARANESKARHENGGNGRAGVCVVLWSRAIRGALVIETDGPYSALSLSRRKPLTRGTYTAWQSVWPSGRA